MRHEAVSFRRAVGLLRQDLGEVPAVSVPDSSLAAGSAPALAAADDAALLASVIDYHHATLKQSPEALDYLRARGVSIIRS